MTSFRFESSGKLKLASAEELAAADEDTAILAYTDGTLEDGRPYYAYVAVRPSKYYEFHALTAARQPMVISDYGDIIMGGFEAEPPPHVVTEMREKYGCDEQYEEKLRQQMLKEQVEFLETQEANRIQDIVAMLKRKSNGSGNPA